MSQNVELFLVGDKVVLDLVHILYIVISSVITIFLLALCKRFADAQECRDKILKASAIVTVILHYSIVYVEYFTNGGVAEIDNNMILAVYPCNVVMWLLLIVSLMKNKKTRFFRVLEEMTFYIGLAGGVIGIVFNENYMSNPTLLDWEVTKGLLSHSTMLFGCIYLLVGNYITIGVKNVVSLFFGLLLLIADGVVVISLFKMFNMDPPNSMYLLENPFPNVPWFNSGQ